MAQQAVEGNDESNVSPISTGGGDFRFVSSFQWSCNFHTPLWPVWYELSNNKRMILVSE